MIYGIINIIIIVVWIFLAISTMITYSKMQNILVKNNKGSWWYCWWKLQFSYRPFKQFVNESNLNSEQKEKYLLLYKRGLYAKRGFFFCFFCFFVLTILYVHSL